MVRDADECFKLLLALFVEKFPLGRFKSSNFTAAGKVPHLLDVFRRSRAACNNCYVNSDEEMELAVALCSNKVEGKASFNGSSLMLNKKNLQITLDSCLSFDMDTLKQFIQEWIRGERDSLRIILSRQDDLWQDLDSFHQNLLEFHPTVVTKNIVHLIVELNREADEQCLRIKVQNRGGSRIAVFSYLLRPFKYQR